MKKTLFPISFLLLSLTLGGCCKDYLDCMKCDSPFLPIDANKTITKICLGSCANQNQSQPILNTAAQQKPDMFIYLGDNIYGDTEDMRLLAKKYFTLCKKSEFKTLQATCPILAVWDDHDYGKNDAGLEYKKKEESKNVFMHFWGEENNARRWSHKGIYDAQIFGKDDQALQIILLDMRTFRTSINYQPNFDPAATMLGTEQWQWLQAELLKPAKVRIIASSTQFGVEYNGFESWANFPLEQEKMYSLIKSTQASGVFFISGDIHYGELSKRITTNTYPIYDFTSSGITKTYPPVSNKYRIGNAFASNHIGTIDIDWKGDSTRIDFSLVDVSGTKQLNEHIYLKDISF